MKNEFYTCPYHNKPVPSGKSCQDCVDYFKNNSIENMTLEQILAEYDLYFTHKFYTPILTVESMQDLKKRMSEMLGDVPVSEFMLLSEPETMHREITSAFNSRKVI